MTAKSIRARKTKGMVFQKEIAEKIRNTFNLEERDVVSTPSAVSGVDVLMSERAKDLFNFSIEAKRQEHTNIWEWVDQAEGNRGDGIPLVVFKRNRSFTYCCMKFDDLLNLMLRYNHYKDKE